MKSENSHPTSIIRKEQCKSYNASRSPSRLTEYFRVPLDRFRNNSSEMLFIECSESARLRRLSFRRFQNEPDNAGLPDRNLNSCQKRGFTNRKRPSGECQFNLHIATFICSQEQNIYVRYRSLTLFSTLHCLPAVSQRMSQSLGYKQAPHPHSKSGTAFTVTEWPASAKSSACIIERSVR